MERAKARRTRGGYSIRAFSQATGIPYSRVKKAVDLGQIELIVMGGVGRIPEREAPRVLALYGDDVEAGGPSSKT
jgi:hypothetical protein